VGAHRHPIFQGLIRYYRGWGPRRGPVPLYSWHHLRGWGSSESLAALRGPGPSLCTYLPKVAMLWCETFFVTVAVALGGR
jgi:hypothetical protein